MSLLIEWNQDLSVGVPSIDEQHKRLVDLINTLNAAMESGETDAVLEQIFDDLIAYTDTHFESEEALFTQTRYPESPAHRAEHHALREKVTRMKQRLDAGEFILGVEVMNFLREWLTHHIQGSDKAYSRHMVDHGIR